MKKTMTIVLLCAGAICANAAPQQATGKKPADSTAQAVTIPKDAVPNPDGNSYSYTDRQGKKWTYTRTPFGVIKAAAPDVVAPASAPAATKVIDKGDTVRFERPGPFGPLTWEKKKTDLTDDERHLLEAQNPQNTDTQPDSKNTKTQ